MIIKIIYNKYGLSGNFIGEKTFIAKGMEEYERVMDIIERNPDEYEVVNTFNSIDEPVHSELINDIIESLEDFSNSRDEKLSEISTHLLDHENRSILSDSIDNILTEYFEVIPRLVAEELHRLDDLEIFNEKNNSRR